MDEVGFRTHLHVRLAFRHIVQKPWLNRILIRILFHGQQKLFHMMENTVLLTDVNVETKKL